MGLLLKTKIKITKINRPKAVLIKHLSIECGDILEIFLSVDKNKYSTGAKDLIPFDRVTHFEYKEHKYIKFEETYGNASVGGVVHDPDCWCSKIKDKNEYRTVN